ncbi:YdeI/OmpD-associated family protein [Pseudoalteromonas sp. MMG012]|nr:YdeI/OmpD-associated family protein [Pseudoalteromonas sp. MMG012]
MTADFLAKVEKRQTVRQVYNTLNNSSRNIIAYGLISAKKAETKLRWF